MSTADSSEDAVLHWLRRRLAQDPRDSPELRIGHDAALVPRGGPWAVTVDSQIEGVHFLPETPPEVVARRLLAVNLSDLAATGAEPAYAFLALTTPPGFAHRRFFAALLAACESWGVRLAGGDLASHPTTFVATLTLVGRKPPRGRWLRRSGALPGDVLWVGGTLGESAAGYRLLALGARLHRGRVQGLPDLPRSLRGVARKALLRHLAPTPQLALGRWLGRRRRCAAMDLSDGLSRDLRRLARESRVGAEIQLDALPYSQAFAALCRFLEVDPLALALGGGEDYVLLFTLPSGESPPPRFACQAIGEIRAGAAIYTVGNGDRAPLPELGWDHLKPSR
jgi:thiamine-monophosphate kinase